MVKKIHVAELKNHLFGIAKISGLNMLIGVIMIVVCQVLPIGSDLLTLDEANIPTSAWSIFLHNMKVSIIYIIPYVGLMYYTWSSFVLYALIGVYIYGYGYFAAVTHLWHLPLEVFASSIPLYVALKYKKMRWQEICYCCTLLILLLLVSAYVEFFWSKGV